MAKSKRRQSRARSKQAKQVAKQGSSSTAKAATASASLKIKPTTRPATNAKVAAKTRTKTTKAKVDKQAVTTKLPSAFSITGRAISIVRKQWKLFLGIAVVYGTLTLVLVQGLSNPISLAQARKSLALTTPHANRLDVSLSLFSYLITNSGTTTSDAGGVYQTFIIILCSLVVIWALRQTVADRKVTVRTAFYSGTYPFVQEVLVLLLVGLEILPLLLGGWVVSVIMTQ